MGQQDLRKPGYVLKFGMLFAILLIVLSGVTAGGIKLWNSWQTNKTNNAIKVEVNKEESKDEKFGPIKLSDADAYVADFAFVANVSLTKDGFTPQSLTVKPKTKVIFTSGDAASYTLDTTTDSPKPKYFIAKSAISAHSLVQLKFETAGTYTFLDSQQPDHRLTIVVSQ